MLGVLIVFVTNIFGHLEVCLESRASIDDPGLRENPRVIDGDSHVHIPEVAAVERFGQVHLLGVRSSGKVVPGFLKEADGVHNELVAFPMSA